MSPFTPADFADDTEYERFVLASLGAHRTHPGEPSAIFHLEANPRGGGAIVVVGLAASTGGQRLEDLKASLQIVGFGAGYKALDLLVEHVLRSNGATERLTFADKTRALQMRPTILPPPFDAHPEYWDRLAALYVNLADARHAVTHRRGGATAKGDLEVHDNSGARTDTVTGNELSAFLAAVHAAAELAINGSADSRRHRILAWYLNALATRHGLPPLPADDPNVGVGMIVADLATLEDGQMQIDVQRLRKTVDQQEAREVWNLELRGGGRVFTGRWEDVPDPDANFFTFNPAVPPLWLTEQLTT